MRRLINFFSVGNSGFWFVVGSLILMVVTTFGVGLMALLFNTSMVGGFGILLMVVVVGGLLAASLGVETALKSQDRDIPSWLVKANRVLISVCLGWAMTQVLFQAAMVLGRSFHFYPNQWVWVVVVDLGIMILVSAAGFFAAAFKAEMGKEFGGGIALTLLLANLIMAMVNLGASYADPAIRGELYIVWETPSCAEEPGHAAPAVVPGWELSVEEHHLLGPDKLINRRLCEAEQVDLSNPNHRLWVRVAQDRADANQGTNLVVTGIRVLVGLTVGFFLAMGAGLAFHALKGVWTGKVGAFGLLGGAVLLAMLGFSLLCCGLNGAEMVGINPYLQARQARAVVTGETLPFYDPFQIQAEGWHYLGYPASADQVRLCHCGATTRQVWLETDYHAMPRYATPQYPMPRHGCGGQLNVGPQDLYRVYNRASDPTPVMKMMRAGESFVCPDGSTITAR